MHIELTPKAAKISASHCVKLFGPDHKCAQHHGHTWWFTATFSGEPDERGLLVDFAVVSEVAKVFCHKNLNELPHFERCEPTLENLAVAIISELVRASAAYPQAELTRLEVCEDPDPGGNVHRLVWLL